MTTGPVSVPVLLALGIGSMKSAKDKRLASLMLQQAVLGGGQQPALDGFGIVTLASLFPVLAVQLLGITLSFVYTHDDIVNRPEAVFAEDLPHEISPVREVVFAVRAILPLNFAMVFLVLFIIREPIPHLSIFPIVDIVPGERVDAAGGGGGPSSTSASATLSSADPPPVETKEVATRWRTPSRPAPPMGEQDADTLSPQSRHSITELHLHRHSITICEVQAALESPALIATDDH